MVRWPLRSPTILYTSCAAFYVPPRQVQDIRLLGGDCAVSFGGAAGLELAQVRTDEEQLVSAGGGSAVGLLVCWSAGL